MLFRNHRRENFTTVDAAWLHMDEPTNMAMIVGVIMFDEPIEFSRLKTAIRERLLAVPRFRQRVREPLFGIGIPKWEFDPDFDLDAHLHHIALPAPHDHAALQDLVSDLMGTPLDPNKPLWDLHLVDNYGKGCALVCRCHHAMGDGLALVQVLLALDDSNASPVDANAILAESAGDHHQPPLPVVRILSRSIAIGRKSLSMVSSGENLRNTALVGVSGAVALGKLLLIGPDQPTPLKGKCGVVKRAVWTRPMPLSSVKAVAHSLGCTINDVLVSTTAGAVHRYLEERGTHTLGMEIRAIVPVNLRAPDDLDLAHLGNRFGLVFLALPIGIADPLMRLQVIKERMDYIKKTPEAVVAFGILSLIGATPVALEHVINGIFGAKASMVMTNVPGPRERLRLCGANISGMMFWVPTPAHLGLGVSIISYAGQVTLGVAVDAGLVPDPDRIIAGFYKEFEAYQDIAHVPVRVLPEPVGIKRRARPSPRRKVAGRTKQAPASAALRR